MKRIAQLFLLLTASFSVSAQSLKSPDKKIKVTFSLSAGRPVYNIDFEDKPLIVQSQLGLQMDDTTIYSHFRLIDVSKILPVNESYGMLNAKKSQISYHAEKRIYTLKDDRQNQLQIIFQVSNDGVAFRYQLPPAVTSHYQIKKELTSYRFEQSTTAWLQPKAEAKTGFEHTNPSYEENYKQEVSIGTHSKTGWVYPALFHTDKTWVLITEAGMDGKYPGTMLYNDSGNPDYRITFPDVREEIPGSGTLPKNATVTPWRVVTIGSLKTIAESTLGTDVALPAVKVADASYIRPGKASWSWIMSKDDSITYTETKRYIDFAHKMNWQYCLIDANWDTKIGYDRVKELVNYGASQNVGILLWYNSAGNWNTVKMTPKDKMATGQARDEEFARLKQMGVKGIKIDFFGGDGQSMIQYYIDILKSALKYKLLVNFHGATLPRGWARTYPNLMSTEAVKGFEMITFGQGAANDEATHGAMLPFTRNAFDPMDFTPMNLYKIQSQVKRKTTSGFELATSVLYLSGIQHYAESPAGMAHMPDFVIQFLQNLPDHWDDVRFIDGYPGKLAVIARRGKGHWYVAGINGENKDKQLTLDLSSFGAHRAQLIADGADAQLTQSPLVISPSGKTEISLKPNGGFVIRIE